MNDDIKRLELEIAKLKLQQANEAKVSENKSTFSIWWFIFWLIVCWPIAVIMVVHHSFKNR